MKTNKKKSLIIGGTVCVLSFLSLIVNGAFIGKNTLEIGNYIAFAVFGFIVGAISFAFYLLKSKILFYFFISGLAAGLISMMITMSKNMDGWTGIIAFIGFMMFLIGGLVAGIVIHIAVWLIKKRKNK